MARSRSLRLVQASAVALTLAGAVAACGSAAAPSSAPSSAAPVLTGAAAGQVIFEQSCASCHGTGGVGQKFTMDNNTIEVPAITYPELEALYHDKYDTMVVDTIVKGVDEEGQALNRMMPRWTIFSDQQMADLVAYLKSLQ